MKNEALWKPPPRHRGTPDRPLRDRMVYTSFEDTLPILSSRTSKLGH